MAIGWGILGCGTIADKRIAPAIAGSDNARLVAFCSRAMERAADFAERHGADRGYDDLDDLIADPEVVAVYVATPNANHYAETIRLLAGGKHVLCDKPLALTSEQAEEMLAAAEASGTLLGVAHQMRYLPGLQQVRELIVGGELGKLLVLRTGFGYVSPPRDIWRQKRALAGGGPLMDLGPHVVDALRWLAGEIVSVQGELTNALFNYEVEDTASAVLGFESGAIGLLDVGYSYSDATLTVIGSEGAARLDKAYGQAVDWELAVTIGGETARQAGRADRAYVDEIEDFSEAILADRPAPISGLDGLRTIEVIEAIVESAESGERVELKD
ncbi:MAG: Gfo/Idh/MocA family oxidoreductase [Phycisphaerae bacterium]|nr:Gfo/Idh/MocA family oxidoreductase [Phycisphaerae bacterium]